MVVEFKNNGYATQANALKKVTSLNLDKDIPVVIAAQGDRYYPVVFLRTGWTHLLHHLASNGVYVIG